MISLNKNQPKYLYKVDVAFIVFLVLWFALGVPLMVTIGCIYDESAITYIVMGCTFAVFIIGLFIFVLVDKKLRKRLVEERAAQLEEEFTDMPFEEAERILKEKGIITDAGFVVKTDGVFGEGVLPFEEALFDFHFFQLQFRVNMDIELYTAEGDFAGIIGLDRATYNFLANQDTDLKNDFAFKLFVKDKKEFAKFALSNHGMHG